MELDFGFGRVFTSALTLTIGVDTVLPFFTALIVLTIVDFVLSFELAIMSFFFLPESSCFIFGVITTGLGALIVLPLFWSGKSLGINSFATALFF